jgi:hypothetical protein
MLAEKTYALFGCCLPGLQKGGVISVIVASSLVIREGRNYDQAKGD